jgi:hypothetical protein
MDDIKMNAPKDKKIKYEDPVAAEEGVSHQWLEFYKITATLLGNIGLPLAIIFVAGFYHSDIASLFARAQSAEYGGGKIGFNLPGVSGAKLNLIPYRFIFYSMLQSIRVTMVGRSKHYQRRRGFSRVSLREKGWRK